MKNQVFRSLAVFLIVLITLSFSFIQVSAQTTNLTQNKTGKTIIRRISKWSAYNNTFLIISSQGTVIVADPWEMPKGFKADIITATHDHNDHVDWNFIKGEQNANSRKSLYTAEEFTVKDVKVTGVLSSHILPTIDPKFPSNVIYIFEVDGLRIAHMGDIGQEDMTPEQLKILGHIDIAFMQFENPFSQMSLENGKGLHLIEQIKPEIIIPTHASPEGIQKVGEAIGTLKTVKDVLVISKDDLKDGKRKVIDLQNSNPPG